MQCYEKLYSLIIWLMIQHRCLTSEKVKTLNIMGMLPMTGTVWPGGGACLPAVQMAMDHVHNTEQLLTNYRLNFTWIDTKCDPGLGVDGMYRLLRSPPTKLFILCCVCSIESIFTGQASHYWNINQVAYGSSSEKLSDKERYPRFFRLAIPDGTTNDAKIELFKYFGWQRIGMIDQALEFFKAITDDLSERLKDTNVTVVTKEIYNKKPITQIANLKNQDVRIILVGAYMNTGRQLLCEAYKSGIYGKRYAWFFPKAFSPDWWKTDIEHLNCTAEQMEKAAEGHILTTYNYRNTVEERGPANITVSEWEAMYAERMNYSDKYKKFELISSLCYDSVWVMALALDETDKKLKRMNFSKSLDQFQYGDKKIADIITSEIANIQFTGVMGNIAFGNDGDPLASLRIMQMNDGKYRWAGTYDPLASGQKIKWRNGGIRWPDNKPPKDRTIVIYNHHLVSTMHYIAVAAIAGVGIILAVIFFIFNTVYRNHRNIKMSSPNINNSLLCGCVIAHASVFVQPHNYRLSSAMCKARLFLLTMGFSIVFGSLFSKMWRVNRIFSNKKMQRVKIKDSQLLVFIFLLLGVNLTILILWEIIDPLYVEHVMGDVETDYGNEDTLIQYVMDVCSSKHSTTFSVVLYTIQGVLLSFGAFLAWATRNVKIEALNDSRLVGMCIYTVVILCAIGLTLTQVIGDTVFIIDGFVTVGTSFTQLILFSPKVLQVKGIDNVGQLILYLETIVDTQGAAAHVIHEGERNSKSRSSSKNIPSPSKHVRNIASTSNQHPTHTPTTDDIVRRKSPIIEEDNVQTIES